MGWIDNDTFEFFVPASALSIEKGGKKSKDGKRWIQGVASTDAKDLQGEIVDQNGIDFSYFLKYGYFNNDHKPGFDNKVGQPTECRVTKNGLWVKGFLFNNHSVSNSIWELMNSLESTGASRKIGFSIQGKVKRRQGTKIKECWIQDVAITPAPVNTTTWAEIAKSLSAQEWDAEKSQSMTTQNVPANTNPLVAESLEGKMKKDREEKTEKSLCTFEDTVVLLQNQHGLPEDAAVTVAKAIFAVVPESIGVNNECK